MENFRRAIGKSHVKTSFMHITIINLSCTLVYISSIVLPYQAFNALSII